MAFKPHAVWTCDNQREFETLLAAFEMTVERSGDSLLLKGARGLEVEIYPGDGIIIDGERIGISRVPVRQPEPEKITVACANPQCGKPVTTYRQIAMDADTVGIVCGQHCAKVVTEMYERFAMTASRKPN